MSGKPWHREDREIMEYDVLIVGAGPAGLSAAIRLKQLAAEKGKELSVCLIEKGAEVGAHILSGAAIDPRALFEFLPKAIEEGAPLNTPIKKDGMFFLTSKLAFPLPIPPSLHNHGNYIVSLGELCRWMAQKAEALGVEIYAGFAGAELLLGPDGEVRGVATGDQGLGKDGEKTASFAAGVELVARQTLFAEGCHGSLTKRLFAHFDLRKDCDPQAYGIGIKELWEVPEAGHKPGAITHTLGWPLDFSTYGGSFIYHYGKNLVAIGFVVGLDYKNPWISPFEEFQRFKQHPKIRKHLEGGKRIAYGARAITEGGIQSLPKLTFPGGLLAGDCAGFLNLPKIKGVHTAMKSGTLAAECVFGHLAEGKDGAEVTTFLPALKKSWLWKELWRVRNVRPAFHWGLLAGVAHAGLDGMILQGRVPWTFRNHHDHTQLKPAAKCKKPDYPKPDGVISFDRLSSVYLSNTSHAEEQPCHLVLENAELAISVNHARYASPEVRYCPAGVYEIVEDEKGPHLHINFSNCVHCKTCDIKDPEQNIDWRTPEGGGGPNYSTM